MATRTITRMFDTSEAAHAAVRDLEAAGFAHDDVTYMGGQDSGTTVTDDEARGGTGAETGAATGATLGTVLGGGAGLLAGLGALAIPGVGPVVAAGWLVATLAGAGVGAAAGGLIGALVQAGVGEEHAEVYAEGLRRGGHLVAVRAEEGRATEAEAILERHGPTSIEERREQYRAEGWSGFDRGAAADVNPAMSHPAAGPAAAVGDRPSVATGSTATGTGDDRIVGAPKANDPSLGRGRGGAA